MSPNPPPPPYSLSQHERETLAALPIHARLAFDDAATRFQLSGMDLEQAEAAALAETLKLYPPKN